MAADGIGVFALAGVFAEVVPVLGGVLACVWFIMQMYYKVKNERAKRVSS